MTTTTKTSRDERFRLLDEDMFAVRDAMLVATSEWHIRKVVHFSTEPCPSVDSLAATGLRGIGCDHRDMTRAEMEWVLTTATAARISAQR